MKPKTTSIMWTIALTAVLSLIAALPCTAATTWTVTSPADNGAGTLRAALASAADGDTINFALTLPATIALTSGYLMVDKSVTITGPGQDQLIVDGQKGGYSVFGVWPEKTVTISGLTIANAFTYYYGGGVLNWGTLTLSDCTLRGNSAVMGGGGVFSAGPLRMTRCTLSDNWAGVTEEYWGGGGVAFVPSGAGATMTIESSRLINNTAPYGGGIVIGGAGDSDYPLDASVTVANSTLSGNSAGLGHGTGGGMAIMLGWCADPDFCRATVTVENSTLNGNSSSEGFGGAIFSDASGGRAVLNLKNSTLSGNWAEGLSGGIGGAIANFASYGGSATLNVDNSTLSGNWDNGWAGGILNGVYEGGNSEVALKNSILNAGPSGANLAIPDWSEVGAASFVSYGYNLCSDDGSGFLTDPTDRIYTDPQLGPLADNGGPTLTHALLTGSPAIDAGSLTDIAGIPVSVDQRGVMRPQGSANDIGAFELESLTYSWSGVLQPINSDGTSVFKAGSTVPVKFKLTGGSAGITDLKATLAYALISSTVVGSINEAVSTSAATTGNLFRYDPTARQYIFNWSTKGLAPGTYRLFINLGDGVEHTVNVGLR